MKLKHLVAGLIALVSASASATPLTTVDTYQLPDSVYLMPCYTISNHYHNNHRVVYISILTKHISK